MQISSKISMGVALNPNKSRADLQQTHLRIREISCESAQKCFGPNIQYIPTQSEAKFHLSARGNPVDDGKTQEDCLLTELSEQWKRWKRRCVSGNAICSGFKSQVVSIRRHYYNSDQTHETINTMEDRDEKMRVSLLSLNCSLLLPSLPSSPACFFLCWQKPV